MVRLVLDTNVLINADRGEGSYGKRILDLVRQGQAQALISRAVRQENKLIINRLLRDKKLRAELEHYLTLAQEVEPRHSRGVMLEDEEDYKLLDAAVGGGAQLLITDDRHLLEVGEYEGVRVVTPAQFWQWWQKHQDDSGHTWATWTKNILGR
ncbi:MAG: putative toxin-antitoxin system toxin component, PIN family [Candidatus Kerfeldbacteria bacterium]|nr:putative toxin-antitoxin system toxin component, PIN family [Candidatus Kerfeldbacteria bacterium]